MILVTGGSGFIGRALAESFGEDAITLGRYSVGNPGEYRCDLTDMKEVKRVAEKLKDYSFTHLVHTAAVTPWSNEPNFQADKTMADAVLWLCDQLRIPQLFFISGWNVYGATNTIPLKEDAHIEPLGEYAISKYEVEQILTRQTLRVSTLNLRLASVYGPGQLSTGLIPNLVSSALDKQEISFSNPNTKRDYIYINDVTKVIHQLVKNNVSIKGNLNIGSGRSVSVAEVVKTVQSVCRELYDMEVRIKEIKEGSVPQFIDNELDISKARSLNLLPTTAELKDGLKQYIEWRKNENIL